MTLVTLARGRLCWPGRPLRIDADEPTLASAVFELHNARNRRKERVVLAPTDIGPGLEARSALPDQNCSATYQFSAKALDAKALSL
jgi:hypothetical protein